jgi:O-acetyl-ADP-ribose deacetylase
MNFPTVVRSDILEERTDIIVNPANEGLRNHGGLALKIAQDAGPEFKAACKAVIAAQGSVPTGTAVATTGGHLHQRWVISTPGPIYSKHAEPEVALASCYRESIKLAAQLGAKTISFPAISCGHCHPGKHAGNERVRYRRSLLLA